MDTHAGAGCLERRLLFLPPPPPPPPCPRKPKGSACRSLLTTRSSRTMQVGCLRAENSWLPLLVEALCCVHYSVAATHNLYIQGSNMYVRCQGCYHNLHVHVVVSIWHGTMHTLVQHRYILLFPALQLLNERGTVAIFWLRNRYARILYTLVAYRI